MWEVRDELWASLMNFSKICQRKTCTSDQKEAAEGASNVNELSGAPRIAEEFANPPLQQGSVDVSRSLHPLVSYTTVVRFLMSVSASSLGQPLCASHRSSYPFARLRAQLDAPAPATATAGADGDGGSRPADRQSTGETTVSKVYDS